MPGTDASPCGTCLTHSLCRGIGCQDAYNRRMAKPKRGYSHEFPINQSRRIKREIDWVPPALDRSLRAKMKREGLSLRVLTLRLWTDWLHAPSSSQESR